MPTKMWCATLSFLTVGTQSYFPEGCQFNSIRTFHIYCPILVKFCITDLHLTLSSHSDFRENRCSKGHTFLTGFEFNFIRTFHIYCPILVKFCITHLHLTLSSHFDFRENRRSKAHTFLKGVNLTLSVLSTFVRFWLNLVLQIYT